MVKSKLRRTAERLVDSINYMPLGYRMIVILQRRIDALLAEIEKRDAEQRQVAADRAAWIEAEKLRIN